jgi:hypothetical protein
VPQEKVMPGAIALAEQLASKPRTAMGLDRRWLREMTEEGFRECLAAAVRIHRESYVSGEPTRMMNEFLAQRAARKK